MKDTTQRTKLIDIIEMEMSKLVSRGNKQAGYGFNLFQFQ